MRLNFLHFFHHHGSYKDEATHLPFARASLAQTILTVLFLTLFGAVVIVPFVYMVVISMKSPQEIGNGRIIPDGLRTFAALRHHDRTWLQADLSPLQAAALVTLEKVPVMPWPAEASAVLGPPRMSEDTPLASRLKLSKNPPPLDTVRALLEVVDLDGGFAKAGSAAIYLPSTVGSVEGVAATVVPRTAATLTMRLLSNYASLLRWDDLTERGFFQWIRQGYPRWYMNSLFVALSTVLLGVFFDSLAAFAFAKFNFPFKRTLFAMLLATIMIPYPVTLVPTFFIFARMGFYNTYAALVVPGLVSAFGVFLVRQYMRTIPDDMIDAGRVDGASDFRVYWHIVLPAARPVLAALAVFRFIWQWNMYLFPLVLTNRDSMKTVQLGLATMQDAYGTVDHSVQMAGATLAVIPILVVYMLMQRHFISGITLGSVKE